MSEIQKLAQGLFGISAFGTNNLLLLLDNHEACVAKVRELWEALPADEQQRHLIQATTLLQFMQQDDSGRV